MRSRHCLPSARHLPKIFLLHARLRQKDFRHRFPCHPAIQHSGHLKSALLGWLVGSNGCSFPFCTRLRTKAARASHEAGDLVLRHHISTLCALAGCLDDHNRCFALVLHVQHARTGEQTPRCLQWGMHLQILLSMQQHCLQADCQSSWLPKSQHSGHSQSWHVTLLQYVLLARCERVSF